MKTAKFSSALLIALLASPAFAQLSGLGGIGSSVGGGAGGGIGVGSMVSPGAHAGFGTPVNVPRDIERPAMVDKVTKADALKVDESLTREVAAKRDSTEQSAQDGVFTEAERAQLDAMRDVRLRDAEAAEAAESRPRRPETGDSLLARMSETGAAKGVAGSQSADAKVRGKSAADHRQAAAGGGEGRVGTPRVKDAFLLAGKRPAKGGGNLLASTGSSGTAALKGAGSGGNHPAASGGKPAHPHATAAGPHAGASRHTQASHGETTVVGRLAANAAGSGKTSSSASGHGSHQLAGSKATRKNAVEAKPAVVNSGKPAVKADAATHADTRQNAGVQLADSRRPASAGHAGR